MAEQKLEAGDEVLHKPSGQVWVAWGVDSRGGYLLNMGWPNELTSISHFELHGKGLPPTLDERRSRAQKFGRRFDDDRADEARDNERMNREWAL
jgi:hypothetical protein